MIDFIYKILERRTPQIGLNKKVVVSLDFAKPRPSHVKCIIISY